MADVLIDITAEDGELALENPHAFDLRITGCGLQLDINHDHGRALYEQLRQWFEEPEGTA